MASWQEQLQPVAPTAIGSPVGSAQVSGPGVGARPQGSAQVSAQPMSVPQGPLFGQSVPVAAPNSADESIEPAASGLKKWGYIAIALLVVLLGAGALYYTSRPNPPTYDVGNCVKESNGKAAEVPCSESDAYQIVSKVSDPSHCPDAKQPYATIDGSILCLKKK